MVIAKDCLVDYDLETGASRPIADVPCDTFLVSPNRSTLVTVKQVYDGDVWPG